MFFRSLAMGSSSLHSVAASSRIKNTPRGRREERKKKEDAAAMINLAWFCMCPRISPSYLREVPLNYSSTESSSPLSGNKLRVGLASHHASFLLPSSCQPGQMGPNAKRRSNLEDEKSSLFLMPAMVVKAKADRWKPPMH